MRASDREMCYNVVMLTKAEAKELLTANQTLQATNTLLLAETTRLLALVTTLEARLAALAAAPGPPPSVQLQHPRPAAPALKPARKQRAAAHNHGRPRATPTAIRIHAYDTCPTCAYTLRSQSIARCREVRDVPLLTPVQVIKYQILKRYCPHCECRRELELRLDGLVIGHGRLSTRILGWIA